MTNQDTSKNGARSQIKKPAREVLPIPDLPYDGLITYDAKDPDSKFPPIEPLQPPEGAPNVLLILMDDAGFGATSRFGGPCATPNIERFSCRRPHLQSLPRLRVVRADAPGVAHRPEPPFSRNGRHHGDCNLGARL